MYEFQELSVFSKEEAKELALKDANSCSTSPDYAKDNTLTYFLLCNTWTLLVKEYCPHAWIRFATHLREEGLIPCIKEMQEEADLVVHEEDMGPWASIFSVDFKPTVSELSEFSLNPNIGKDRVSTILFLLRYPKRFSPCDNDIIQTESLRDFLNYENRTKLLQRHASWMYDYVCSHVRDYILNMYPWKTICTQIRKHKYDWVTVSTGASTDAKQSFGDKLLVCVKSGSFPDLIRPVFGQRLLATYPNASFNEETDARRIARIQAVPKSYKASRIIAVDSTIRLVQGKFVESLFRDIDRRKHKNGKAQVFLEDQSINQNLARIGSAEGYIATLDASHASDLISRSLFVDLFPPEYVSLVSDMMPDYFQVGNGIRPAQMSSSSGNALTFRHETIVYKAIVGAAEQYAQALGISLTPVAWAYGDDSLVNSQAYDIAVKFFSVLGLIINPDKSYWKGSYRESCGKDFMNGLDVSSVYYPRFPIIGHFGTKNKVSLSNTVRADSWRNKLDNSLTMLIDLQKKLLPLSYSASLIISSIVTAAYPSVTTSVPGEVCADLWDFVETGRSINQYSYSRKDNGLLTSLAVLANPVHTIWDHSYTETKVSDVLSILDEGKEQFSRNWKQDKRHCYPSITNRPRQLSGNRGNELYTPEEIQLYNYWRYMNFLRVGPSFEDPLLELLRISSEPISIGAFYGRLSISLVTK